MHSCLPDSDDGHNVAKHFRLQSFLSEQNFASLPVSCSSAVILLFFITALPRRVERHLGCSLSHVAFGLPAGFSQDLHTLITFLSRVSTGYLVTKGTKPLLSLKLIRISNNKCLLCITPLLKLLVNIKRMFVN